MTKIVIDAFGGDHAPSEIVYGAADALNADKDLSIVLCGKKDAISSLLAECNADMSRVEIVDADDVITNDDVPTDAIRKKKNSSLVVALERLHADDAVSALVSAGSTGAVLTGAFMKVGRIKGISRPALAPVLPSVKGKGVILCDCGANVDCKAINLLHFALMAKAFSESMLDVQNPRIALLSNGTEDHKGTPLNQEAFALLKAEKSLNFIGNCEARDILSGEYDVIVSDGFNGNIALKSAEGTANALFSLIMDGINNGGVKSKLGALMLKPVFRSVKRRMDYNNQGGAVFLGVNKVIVKSHGASKRKSIQASVLQAKRLADAQIVDKIKSGLQVLAPVETNDQDPQQA